MKKIYAWMRVNLSGVKMKAYAETATAITTALLSENNPTVNDLLWTVGLESERLKVKEVLEELLPDFVAAQTKKGRKAIASRMGAEILRKLDGKNGKASMYIELFELFLNRA